MPKRPFIEIDKDKCNGCGQCVTACAEGALQIVDGKAVVVNEAFCDGLGACIGDCPEGALRIVEKEVSDFDEKAVEKHLREQKKEEVIQKSSFGCPGMAMKDFRQQEQKNKGDKGIKNDMPSRLEQWPIQLHLVNPGAPYFKGSNLLIAASCTAFSFGKFHEDFIKGHAIVIACPKLDRTEGYIEKLSEIINQGDIKSITVARMEVPCCQGLTRMVKEAIQNSSKKVPFLEQIIGIKGDLKE